MAATPSKAQAGASSQASLKHGDIWARVKTPYKGITNRSFRVLICGLYVRSLLQKWITRLDLRMKFLVGHHDRYPNQKREVRKRTTFEGPGITSCLLDAF